MNGILIINKPRGMTSNQVVGRLRRILGIKKIGHTGTLDPDVDGVLPMCIGNATRIAEYMLDQRKAYTGEVTFGYSTDTQDASGEVMDRVAFVSLTEDQVKAAFTSFQGDIMQIPPAYSAIKVAGKRAYDLARQGQKVELSPRQVHIYSLVILSMQLDKEHPKVRFAVESSKGTYVRTLCYDIGQKLGIPSHMSDLTRTRSGPFTLGDAYTIEQIEEAQNTGTIDQFLVSASVAVKHFPLYHVSEKQEKRVSNGMEMIFPLQGKSLLEGERIRIESSSGNLLAIYRVKQMVGQSVICKPEKVFKE